MVAKDPRFQPGGTYGSSAKTAANPYIHTNPDGSQSIYNPATGKMDPYAPAPPAAVAKPANLQSDGGTDGPYLVTFDPNTGRRTYTTNPNYIAPPGATEADLLQQQLQIEQSKLNLQKSQQDLIPPESLAYQQMNDAIDYIQQQMTAGLLKPDEGEAYMTALKQQFQASLQGTTPWQQQESQRLQQNTQKQLGWDILNNNAQRSTSLASSLMGTAGSMAQSIAMPPGQTTLGVDPLIIARNYANQANGGNQMTNFAQQLLQGAQGQQGAPSQGQFPTTREGVLAQYPDLAGR